MFFPPSCYHCGRELVGDERYLCMSCQMNLPLTGNAAIVDNETEMRLGGRVPVEAGVSLMYYDRQMSSRAILHNIKYHGHYKMAHDFGAKLGEEIARSGRFEDVDCLVPVPLHWAKKWLRGYNQSELLCQGINRTFPRPICKDVLYRNRYTRTQTHKSFVRRQENMQGVFSVKHAEKLADKHILLVDDVITTGATTDSCWNVLKAIPGIRVSIASLAITNGH